MPGWPNHDDRRPYQVKLVKNLGAIDPKEGTVPGIERNRMRAAG
jgi:hypothetical protein